MAKINHNNHLNTIDTLFTDAKNRGVLHLNASGGEVAGRTLQIEHKELRNFGSLGYLGLETDARLKAGAMNYTRKFGTQSVMSRTYISTSIVNELEEMLDSMFGCPTLIYSRASTVHISLIPTLVGWNDAIILDQQAHFSIQTAAQLMRQKGVPIEMIKHNSLSMLEQKVKELSQTKERIWYLADGVYSMFGDVAPVPELVTLAERFPKLWLYLDDCHGMSWQGKHGTGYVMDNVPGTEALHSRMILVSTMAKGFGVHGGIAAFPNAELHRKVKVFGGPLSYSLPLSPADIGACMASAKIHLSDEIYQRQQGLRDNIDYCNALLANTELLAISNPETPIYFIGMGQPNTGYNMVKRLLNDGIYLNPSFFPMVPAKSTGLRFGLTYNHTKDDIKTLVDALVYHFPKALEEEDFSLNQVKRAFRIPVEKKEKSLSQQVGVQFNVQHSRSITEIDKVEWNNLMSSFGTVDWDGMCFLEEVFAGNEQPEENLDFHYYIIRDEHDTPVIATFFSSGIQKDDFASLPSISKQIEQRREKDPYYLTSRTFITGSMITEGQHMYINREVDSWRDALKLLVKKVGEEMDKVEGKNLVIGDFKRDDEEVREVLLGAGFVKVDMPDSNIIDDLSWDSEEDFLNALSRNNRANVKKEVFRFADQYHTTIKQSLTQKEQEYFYQLFQEVKNRNFGLNFFDYPKRIMQVMSNHPNWEFVILNLKPELDDRVDKKPLAAVWCYRTPTHYSPMIIGMDYSFMDSHKVYKQALYQILLRAKALKLSKVYLGFSADTDKRKFGAKQVGRQSFIQAKDNFNIELIESMGALPKH